MEINVIGGALYTQDGKKIADVKDSSIMLVDEPYKQRTMEVAKNIGKTHSITCQLAPYDMRMIYSFMYGMGNGKRPENKRRTAGDGKE